MGTLLRGRQLPKVISQWPQPDGEAPTELMGAYCATSVQTVQVENSGENQLESFQYEFSVAALEIPEVETVLQQARGNSYVRGLHFQRDFRSLSAAGIALATTRWDRGAAGR